MAGENTQSIGNASASTTPVTGGNAGSTTPGAAPSVTGTPTVTPKPVDKVTDGDRLRAEQAKAAAPVTTNAAPAVVATPTSAPAPTTNPALVQAQLKKQNQTVIVNVTKDLLTTYTADMSKTVLNAAAIAQGATLFTRIILRLIDNPFTEHLDAFLNYVKANKTGLMDMRNALRGMEAINKTDRAKVEIVYVLFYKAAIGDKASSVSAQNATNITKSAPLVNYIIPKLAK